MTRVGSGTETLSSSEYGEYRITKWKILSYDSETKMIEMVPTNPVGRLVVNGAQGYNNVVYLLNKACSELYGDPSRKIEARSIKEEDFEKAGGDAWKSYRETFEGYYAQYNHQYKEYESGYKLYPSIYAKEYKSVIDGKENKDSEALNQSNQKDSISETDDGAPFGCKNANKSINPYQTYYKTMDYDTTQKLLGDKAKILLPNGNSTRYLIATRCIELNTACYFGTYEIFNGYFLGSEIFESNNCDGEEWGPLFPVVSLNAELLVKSTEPYTYTVK